MHFSRSEIKTSQNTSKAVANNSGSAGRSMPAVPVLQQKPAQKTEGEQQENQAETEGQPLQLKEDSFAGEGVVQREVVNKKNDGTELGAVAEEFFNHVNELAQNAYKFAVNAPGLGPYAGLDGYTELWKEKWDMHLAGLPVPLMAATFGYVVESLVSNVLGPFRPTPPGGYTIYYQVVVGGTRPDLVLRKSDTGEDVAWIDLTAAESGGHIFDKDNWDKKVPRYAEVVYPSLSPGTLMLMRANRDNVSAGLTQEEFEEQKKQVEEAYALKKAQWMEMGKNYQYGVLKNQIPAAPMLLEIRPDLKQNFIKDRLQQDFGVEEINIGLIPSILSAMGVLSGPWGFGLGTSSSRAAGEVWLTEHDPAPPTIPENETGIVEENIN
ncbi:hypothetical protein BEL04_16805 [Mucilaginibacter sp. PPCGB 2223]|uniref:hypothetical protein n=1 Tax=Mucilaginibacter sp. PPCGB 2223 TaxID=1886027 RepID=UPI0008260393|nr:hypothetical protein [Mucilaginibacter sp. PPCGB 2223]OCX51677.1 hypothetical protein BEL04_16805 [Mucilaginibacter sp. PPCGB 2223]